MLSSLPRRRRPRVRPGRRPPDRIEAANFLVTRPGFARPQVRDGSARRGPAGVHSQGELRRDRRSRRGARGQAVHGPGEHRA